MSNGFLNNRWPLLWLLLLLGAFGLRSPVLFSSLEHLVTVLPDDAFYYFETARNIISGAGSTFDGQDLADGYQPLWLALLLPIAWLPKLAFVKAALLLGITLHLAALTALGRFVWLISGSHTAALIAPLIYTCNRWAVLQSVNGLETALTSALFCACLALTANFQRTPAEARNSVRWATLIGVSVALLFLARTDQIFYCAAFLVTTLVLVQRRLLWTSRVAVAGLLIAAPWFVGHLLWTGNVLPSSGGAQPLVLRTLAEVHSNFDRGWISFRGFFTGGIFGYTGHDRRVLVPLLAIAAAVIVLQRRAWSSAQSFALSLLLALASAGLVLGFVHTYLRWYPRTWYFDQYIILVAAVLAIALGMLLNLPNQSFEALAPRRTKPPHKPFAWPLRFRIIGVAAALACAIPLTLAAQNGWRGVTDGNYTIQARTFVAAAWLDQTTEADAVIGSWNSGILAFLLDQPVVGLDGAISATSVPYLEARNLSGLICARGVDYLADHASEFERYRPFLPGYERYTQLNPMRLPQATPPKYPTFLLQPVDASAFTDDCRVAPAR